MASAADTPCPNPTYKSKPQTYNCPLPSLVTLGLLQTRLSEEGLDSEIQRVHPYIDKPINGRTPVYSAHQGSQSHGRSLLDNTTSESLTTFLQDSEEHSFETALFELRWNGSRISKMSQDIHLDTLLKYQREINRSFNSVKRFIEHRYICHSCGITKSADWRNGPDGQSTLCNGCDFAKQNQIARQTNTSGGVSPTLEDYKTGKVLQHSYATRLRENESTLFNNSDSDLQPVITVPEPGIRDYNWSRREDKLVLTLRESGMKWEEISKHFENRSAGACQNRCKRIRSKSRKGITTTT